MPVTYSFWYQDSDGYAAEMVCNTLKDAQMIYDLLVSHGITMKSTRP